MRPNRRYCWVSKSRDSPQSLIVRLSLCTRTVEDRRLEDAIQIVAEAGYDGVELLARDPHLPPETPVARVRQIAEQVRQVGLAVACLAAGVGGFGRREEL